ncbi:pre-mRNA 3'-end-processing factor FIP1 [Aphelenchoides avenae]|nr:pre-mRNA 3'-end-processing factor FIP1 [Aphelenchus avenae]
MAEPEQALTNVAEEASQGSVDQEQTVPEDAAVEETAPSAVPAEQEGEEAEGLDFLGEDSSDDEEVVVKIGDIKQNVPYQKSAAAGGAGGASKVDLDGQPTHKGTMIYDLDLASMEDKPWRKPGADITDYFNYGFNEETWNYYCERQKKLRAEYGSNQAQINRFLFNNISLGVPQLTTTTGGRQLVNICGPEKPQKVNKVVIDLSRPPPNAEGTPIPIMRTVLTAPSAVSQSPNFGAPPPSTSDPRSTISDVSLSSSTSPTALASHSIPTVDFSRPPPTRDAAPGEELPPGVEEPGPPGAAGLAASIPPVQNMAIPSLGGMTPSINTSMPPPGFNPNVPPPGIPPVRLGGMPPPAMNVPPPSFYGGLPNHASAGFSSGSVGFSRPPPLLTGRSGGYEREFDRGGDSGDDEYYARRSRRKRSRSRSPDSRRRREDKDRERRHESPYEGRRHKDDRDRDRSDKKRSRTDDRESEDRERKRRKHDRSERSDKKRSSTREDRREKDYSTSRDIKQEIVDAAEDEGLRPPGED